MKIFDFLLLILKVPFFRNRNCDKGDASADLELKPEWYGPGFETQREPNFSFLILLEIYQGTCVHLHQVE